MSSNVAAIETTARRDSSGLRRPMVNREPSPVVRNALRVAMSVEYRPHEAPVAQLDRVLPSEGRGHRFESCRARQ